MSKIDVSVCIFNNNGKCDCYEEDFCEEHNADCYYKKIEQLKQENEELKKLIRKSAKSFCNDYLETFENNKNLKLENCKLKTMLIQKDEVNILFNTLDWNDDLCGICPKHKSEKKLEKIKKLCQSNLFWIRTNEAKGVKNHILQII